MARRPVPARMVNESVYCPRRSSTAYQACPWTAAMDVNYLHHAVPKPLNMLSHLLPLVRDSTPFLAQMERARYKCARSAGTA